MKKMFLFYCICTNAIIAQKRSLEFQGNAAAIQLSSEITYKRFFKHVAFNVHAGYGNYGRKEIKNKQNSAYSNFILSPFPKLGIVKFSNSNVGWKFGAGAGYHKNIGAKHKLQIDVNCSLYRTIDTYNQTNQLTNNEFETDEFKIQNFTVSIGLVVTDTWRLSKRFGVKYGIALPFMSPIRNQGYLPGSITPKYNYLPMYGFEPYLILGIQFSFTKNKTTDETPK